MNELQTEQFRVKRTFSASAYDLNDTQGFEKKLAKEEFERLQTSLALLQTRLFAEGKRSLLVVFQGMDTSGKDGTIKKVFASTNPMGLKVANFRAPNDIERAHDFLWRVHSQLPSRGVIGLFNRSHYGDVIGAKVEGFISQEQCEKRYQHIRDFERMLVDEGIEVIKLFLNMSADEQEQRLLQRIHNPEKHWKFSASDIETRKKWKSYIKAYERAIEETDTDMAPWYMIPANHKWFRNLVAAKILVEKLEQMNPKVPVFDYHKQNIKIPRV